VHNIINEDGEVIDVARHPRMIVKLKIDKKLDKLDMMRVKVFDKDSYL